MSTGSFQFIKEQRLRDLVTASADLTSLT